MSWSQLSSFEYDKEQWYKRYVLGIKDPQTKEMLFGVEIGTKLATDPIFMPQVPRYPKYEHELRFNFGDIPMVGFIDGWDGIEYALGEYKTGKKPWTQKRADTHGQFDMYNLGLWITEKIKPEEIVNSLHWLPTQEHGDFTMSLISSEVHTFVTKRTMRDILNFGMRINKIYKEMHDYCKAHD
jgi:hypothetical protein